MFQHGFHKKQSQVGHGSRIAGRQPPPAIINSIRYAPPRGTPRKRRRSRARPAPMTTWTVPPLPLLLLSTTQQKEDSWSHRRRRRWCGTALAWASGRMWTASGARGWTTSGGSPEARRRAATSTLEKVRVRAATGGGRE